VRSKLPLLLHLAHSVREWNWLNLRTPLGLRGKTCQAASVLRSGGEANKELSLWQNRACRAPGTRFSGFPGRVFPS